MKKIIPVLFLLLSALTSFSQPTADAIDYNDKIVTLQTKIGETISLFGKTLETRDAASIDKAYANLLTVVGESIDIVSKMSAFGGNTDLRDSATALFKYYKLCFETDYKEITALFKKSTDQITQEDVDRYNSLNMKIAVEEAKYDENFQKAQTDFANKYNFNLEEGKED